MDAWRAGRDAAQPGNGGVMSNRPTFASLVREHRRLREEGILIRADLEKYSLIPPDRRTPWQKAKEAFGMLIVYTIMVLLLVRLVGWLL